MPVTQAPKNLRPLASPGEALPDDCGFYKWAWEAFLHATQPTDGRIALLDMPTFQDVFQVKESALFSDQRPTLLSLAPQTSKVSEADTAFLFGVQDVLQAGTQKVLIDQKGNIVWYVIHLNDVYKSFIDDYGLRDRKALEHIAPELTFRTGSLELKSAWQIVSGPVPDNYITALAVVPMFKTLPTCEIVKDGDKTRTVRVALLGIHVVGTIEGHPEFIWSTFEHVRHAREAWSRDVAPAAQANDDGTRPVLVARNAAYSLYPSKGAQAPAAPVDDADVGTGIDGLKLDTKSQTLFPPTPVYRQFPGSKSDDSNEDDAVVSLNEDVRHLFETVAPHDVRSNYQLVGAIWLNTPEDDFHVGVNFIDAAKRPRKQPPFGGEDRLSNTTMESFTQSTNLLPNCLACHDTEGVPGMQPSLLGVSHALSKFYALDRGRP